MEDLSTNFGDTVDEYSVNVYAFLKATPIKDVVCDEFRHANVHWQIQIAVNPCDFEVFYSHHYIIQSWYAYC